MTVYEQAERELSEQRRKQRIQGCKDIFTQIDKLIGENENHVDNIRLNDAKIVELRKSLERFKDEF